MTDLERTEMELVALRHRIETVEHTLDSLVPERKAAADVLLAAGLPNIDTLHASGSPEAILRRIRAAHALHQAGWSYSRMAKVMGCSEKTCQRWCEAGQKKPPLVGV